MYKFTEIKLNNFLSHKESTFQFRENRAILVVGQNLDSSGQKGNGSGKSALNEAICFAVTGQSIRNCKIKELVRDGEQEAKIELLLTHSSNKTIKIERELFTSSKSSTCKVLINGVMCTNCSDINSYNNFILEQLDLTKEDFFNFFLITKENYQPFLSVSDSKKKEIINRFSGAGLIDKIDLDIKQDVQVEDVKLRQVEDEIISLTTKQSIYKEQLEVEQYKNSNEVIEAEQFKKLEIIRSLQQEIDKLHNYYSEVNDILSGVRLTKQGFRLRDRVRQLELQGSIDIHNSQITELSKKSLNIKNEFTDEIEKIKNEETETKQLFEENKIEIKLQQSTIDSCEKFLLGVIECPKCLNKFTLQTGIYDIDSAKQILDSTKQLLQELFSIQSEIEEILKSLEQQKLDINTKIIKSRETLNKEIENCQSQLQSLKKQLLEEEELIVKSQRQLRGYEVEIEEQTTKQQTIQLQIDQKSKQQDIIKEEIERLKVQDNSKIKDLEVKLQQLETELLDKQFEVNNCTTHKQCIASWLLNFKNFKSFLANQSITSISNYTNLYLQNMKSNIRIQLEGYKLMSDGRIKEEIICKIIRDGFEEGSFGRLSAGERGRIEICIILAIQELINLNSKVGGIDLLICDEILDSVDSLGMELLLQSLQPLKKTIMIVSQNEINSLREDTVIVQKSNKVSLIL